MANRTPNISSPLIRGALAFGVVSMSLPAIIIRLAESPAMTIATNRMLASVLLLAPIALLHARRDLGRVTRRDLLWFILLALFTTVGGHTVFNWSLRYVSASTVAVTFVGEPVVAALFAWVFLGEAVAFLVALGGAIVLGGIYVTARAEAV